MYFCQLANGYLNTKCKASIGLEDGAFLKAAFSASSVKLSRGYFPFYARLNNLSCWTAGHSVNNQWIQIYLKEFHIITAIATQGRADKQEWVMSYKIAFSDSYKENTFKVYNSSSMVAKVSSRSNKKIL